EPLGPAGVGRFGQQPQHRDRHHQVGGHDAHDPRAQVPRRTGPFALSARGQGVPAPQQETGQSEEQGHRHVQPPEGPVEHSRPGVAGLEGDVGGQHGQRRDRPHALERRDEPARMGGGGRAGPGAVAAPRGGGHRRPVSPTSRPRRSATVRITVTVTCTCTVAAGRCRSRPTPEDPRLPTPAPAAGLRGELSMAQSKGTGAKITAAVLIGLGVFMLVVAIMLPTYTKSKAMKTPLDLEVATLATGAANILDASSLLSGTPEIAENVPVEARRHVVVVEPTDRDQLSVEAAQRGLPTDKPAPSASDEIDQRLVNATVDNITLDRVSSDPIEGTGSVRVSHEEDAEDATPLPREGLQYKFPFEVEKRSYDYFDLTSRT